MSYLFPIADTAGLGSVQVGANITVDANGVISLPQSLASTATVTFGTVTSTGAVTDSGNRVITSVTGTAGSGITITAATTIGPATAFTVNNTGVLALTAGTGIVLSGTNSNITISQTGSDVIATTGQIAAYTATASDGYIGVTVNPTIITLPAGITGKTYIIKNEAASGTTTVTGTALEKIDGSTSKNLSSLASLSVVFRAGSWRII